MQINAKLNSKPYAYLYIKFINIKALRLRNTDWKSSFTVEIINIVGDVLLIVFMITWQLLQKDRSKRLGVGENDYVSLYIILSYN